MNNTLKYAKVNVRVSDESGKTLFEDHNLFVDTGRKFIADLLTETIASFDKTLFACDLGTDSTTPVPGDVDLVVYAVTAEPGLVATYPLAIDGEPSGIWFQFSFESAGEQTIRELGLFYRPDSDDFPNRHTVTGAPGYMIARLKTTLSSIVVSTGKTITIDWKIIF